MSKKYNRKIRRLKRTGLNSDLALQVRTLWKNRYVKIGVTLLAVIVVALIFYFVNKYNSYDDFKVVKKIKVDSGTGCKYAKYQDFVVRYSSDGISYIDGEEIAWEEGYDMASPMVDICDEYIAVADKNTNDVYIYDEDGQIGKVSTTYPVTKVEVADQGVVAVLMQDKKASYIEVYDKEGRQLISHKTLINENGYPINFAISDDGTKMVVSYVTVTNGAMRSKLMFYNFSSAGKNASDRMVGEFDQYEESIVAKLEFITNDKVVAIGEDIVSIYSMDSTPSLDEEFLVKNEIQKVFCNEDYIGLVFRNDNTNRPYRVEVYNMSGSKILSQNTALPFDYITFSGDNVLMYDDMNCLLISLKGVIKFNYSFKGQINSMIPMDGDRTFLLMDNKSVKKIKLN